MGELLTFLTTHEDQFRRNRLAALYSDFRHLRTLNPDGYEANIEAWRKGLADAAKEGHIVTRGATNDTLVLNLDEELLRALEHPEWGRPLALATVIRDAIAKKEMIPIADYQAAKESIYAKSWGITPWGVLSWGLRQLGLTSSETGEDKLPIGKVVILSNIEEASKAVAQRVAGYTSLTDRIFSSKTFDKVFGNVLGDSHQLSQTDMDVLLTYISREKRLAAYDGQTIKFKGSTESQPLAVTSEDTTIASLKTLIIDLEAQIDGLSARVDALTITARDAVARKNRVAAISALRSKKLAESNLSKQSAVLNQLEEVCSKIGQASDQVELVRIMKSTTGVLKALNKEVGGVERVDDMADQLKEQMTQVDEVGTIIAQVGHSVVVDEGEVDDELEAMEREDQEKGEAQEQKAKEEKERREAEETRRKLQELEAVEREATEKQKQESPKESERAKPLAVAIEENVLGMNRMSLEEIRSAEPAV